MIFSDFSFATSLGLILSQLAITSSSAPASIRAAYRRAGVGSRTGPWHLAKLHWPALALADLSPLCCVA
jgi:hypothetical protein